MDKFSKAILFETLATSWLAQIHQLVRLAVSNREKTLKDTVKQTRSLKIMISMSYIRGKVFVFMLTVVWLHLEGMKTSVLFL